MKRKQKGQPKPAPAPSPAGGPELTEEAAREIQESHQRERIRRVEAALKDACRKERVLYVPQVPHVRVDGATGFLALSPVPYQFLPRESAPPAYVAQFDREVLGIKDQHEPAADAERQ